MMALLVTSLTSCKPDEEIYNPTCKISKIWYRSDVGDPNEVFIYDSKGKQLQQIVVDSLYSYDFTYNKDKTVSKIVHVGELFTEAIDFKWTDQLVDKMTYTVDGQVKAEYVFHRHTGKKDPDKGRIDYIETTCDRAFYDSLFTNPKSLRHQLFCKVFGDNREMAEAVVKSGSKDLQIYSIRRLTYDPGKHKDYNNISSYVDSIPAELTVFRHTLTYDVTSYNPFYGLPFAYAGLSGYYLNLPLTEHIEKYVANQLAKVEDITYSYEGLHYMNDKHYPRQFVTVSSENNVPTHTYIVYKK